MSKRKLIGVAVVFLTMCFCFPFVQPSYSATIVSLESNAGPLADIAVIQFDILAPADVDAADFSAIFPTDWLDLSTGKIVNAFDTTGNASLPVGEIGHFDSDVILGNWVIGNQDAETLTEGVDYQVLHNGSDYAINAVPIPGAIWLLASGLIGIVGIRRRIDKA